MSRANYSYDLDNWDLIRWRGQVASAIKGKRGQQFLKDLIGALDGMPEKRLIADELENEEGDVCAIGALGQARHIDMHALDPEEPGDIARAFDIAEQLAREIAYMNDEYYDLETPEERYIKMRSWIEKQIIRSPDTVV